jgi:hypothetical protein
MKDDFATANGPNGLITNQYALRTSAPDAVRSAAVGDDERLAVRLRRPPLDRNPDGMTIDLPR